ncbi:MAG: NAD-glutamate dehydrogenase [bacterium]|nr:NAD-glutamate dehydrogenase [bacterium]
MNPESSSRSINMIKTELVAQRRLEFKEHIAAQPGCKDPDQVYQVGSIFYENLNTHHARELTPERAYEVACNSLNLIQDYQGESFQLRFKVLEKVLPGDMRMQVDVLAQDRQFLVDSLVEYLHNSNLALSFFNHPLIRLEYDGQGGLKHLWDASKGQGEEPLLSLITFVLKGFSPDRQGALEQELTSLLETIEVVTDDFAPLIEKSHACAIRAKTQEQETEDIRAERSELFEWVSRGNAILLGYCEVYEIQLASLTSANLVESLGLCRIPSVQQELLAKFARLGNYFLRSRLGLNFFELDMPSVVHRRDPVQLILTRRSDDQGREILVYFLVLFTRRATRIRAEQIPVARLKARAVAEEFAGTTSNHAYEEALDLFTEMPKTELFRLDRDELRNLLDQVQFIREFEHCRLHQYQDLERNYLRLTFCLSNRRFSRDIFLKLQKKLTATLGSEPEVNYYFSYGRNLYSHHIYWFPENNGGLKNVPAEALEQWVDSVTLDWDLQLNRMVTRQGLREGYGAYLDVFDSYYKALFSPQQAINDLIQVKQVHQSGRPQVDLRPEPSDTRSNLHIYLAQEATLTQLIPHLHRMGLTILDENKFEFRFEGQQVFLYQFHLIHEAIGSSQFDAFKARLIELMQAILEDRAESDPLNALLFTAQLDVREINLFQLYRNYYLQIGTPYRRDTINQSLINNPILVGYLRDLFVARFDPQGPGDLNEEELKKEILQEIFKVKTVQEDVIFKQLLNLMNSSVRSNYFAPASEAVMAVKFRSAEVDHMPLPRPLFEIYVHGPHMEGIHLRGAMIARGGIRHSDRSDDFRTEVLGLMKTQMMKNVVIVPEGSKGGFVCKRPSANRAELMAEGKKQYQHFIHSLLSLTDNLVQGKVVAPVGVKALDGEDPYLVVAADKGTAHLSDTANEISVGRNFWLKDAFASGGSQGFDHKKMGITAKGAWESVKLHFLEMGKDIQQTPFTTVGIGDMSGDVFGNGMLLSRQTKLVGAFNHLHLFLDPDPDPEASFVERQRLFETPGSTWKDYNAELISSGGGIFERSAKVITLTPEIKRVLGTDQAEASGEELIKIMLQAPVELLWNGGIGTYVRASNEPNHLVGDPSNDAVRITADQLRVAVIGEGGNLGMTQESRVQFAQQGGRLNTDAIDNSAGVDTSDHEVNLKILVEQLIQKGLLQAGAAREALLAELTPDIAEHVLAHNRSQGRILSIDERRSKNDLTPYLKQIGHLSATGLLNRRTEHLSSDDALLSLVGKGIPRPDLAVILSYTKMFFYKELMKRRELLKGPELIDLYLNYFPAKIRQNYPILAQDHRLKAEIIGTVLVNQIIDQAGVTLYARLRELVDAEPVDMLIAYFTADRLFKLGPIRQQILAQLGQRDINLALDLLRKLEEFIFPIVVGLLLRYRGSELNWGLLDQYSTQVAEYERLAYQQMNEDQLRAFRRSVAELKSEGIDDDLSRQVAFLPMMNQALPVFRLSSRLGLPMGRALALSLELEDRFRINGLQEDLLNLKLESEWQRRHRGVLVRRCQAIRFQILSAALQEAEGDPVVRLHAFLKLRDDRNQAYRIQLGEYLDQDDPSLASMAVLLGTLEFLVE